MRGFGRPQRGAKSLALKRLVESLKRPLHDAGDALTLSARIRLDPAALFLSGPAAGLKEVPPLRRECKGQMRQR